ncbi:MAG: flagellar filament capping protein FliD [Proteocatella sp.]
MATITSLTSSSSFAYGVSSKGIGGLATGLDTDELMKGMTIGTRSKIAKQLQSKQLLSWQSDAYRSVSDKLINFSKKYTSYTSSTNLLSSSFYSKNEVTTTGSNADKVSVSGNSDIAGSISIVAASQATVGSVLVGSSPDILPTDYTAQLDPSKTLTELGITDFTFNIGTTDVGSTLTGESTVQDLMNAINSPDSGMKIAYIKELDKFTLTNTGEASISLSGDIAEKLFGTDSGGTTEVPASTKASLTIEYESGTSITLQSATDTFSIDGLAIKVNASFNSEAVDGGDAVKLNSKMDSDSVFSAIKDMVKDYNEMVDTVNSEVSTKRNRNYAPLTDEQKEDMSETEIEKWEKQANKGMLFGNTDMTDLSRELRNVFFSSGTSIADLEAVGISTSSNWQDNGKIIIDESKFKAAIDSNPENIKNIFSDELSDKTDALGVVLKDMDGNAIKDTTSGGVMSRLDYIMKKYAKTDGATKGILVQKAGSSSSPLSLLKNTLLTKMNDIDTIVTALNRTLASQQKTYQSQFSRLEKVISQLNSQSSWLSQQ